MFACQSHLRSSGDGYAKVGGFTRHLDGVMKAKITYLKVERDFKSGKN